MSALYDEEQRVKAFMDRNGGYHEEWVDAERRLKQSGRNREYRDQVKQSFWGVEWKMFPLATWASVHIIGHR